MTLKQYLLAGRATFTVKSIKTGNRRTFRVTKCPPEKIRDKSMQTLHFVSYLSGPDNESNYTYLGMIVNGQNFFKSRRSSPDFTSATAFDWLWTYAHSNRDVNDFPEGVLFYPSSRCCRCGRSLTTPESIINGIGPECIDKIG